MDQHSRTLDAAGAGALLRRLDGLSFDSVEPILGGWAYLTFDLDGRWIARFPRTDPVAGAARRELRLLPALAQHVSFAVPRPEHGGEWDGWPFFVYRRIHGRSLLEADFGSSGAALGQMLAELHSFPLDMATTLLETPASVEAWRDHYRRLWPIIEHHVLPVIGGELARRVKWEFHRFVEGPLGFPRSFVHFDLGPEHVLVGDEGRPVGIIDFEDATIGDPAVDFVALRRLFGAAALEILLAGRDLGPRLEERLSFYSWMGAVHAIIYGVTEGIEAERRSGIEGLRRRLDQPFDRLLG